MALSLFTRCNVPLFFMISGALLLEKRENYRTIFTRRISKIACMLVILTAVLCVIDAITTPEKMNSFSVKDFVMAFVRYLFGGTEDIGGNAYWYLYAYIGFLILLPMLHEIATRMRQSDFMILLSLHVGIYVILPLVNIVVRTLGIAPIGLSANFLDGMGLVCTRALFYPLMGYYIDHRLDVVNWKAQRIVGVGILMVAGLLMADWCTWYDSIFISHTLVETYIDMMTFVFAFGMFLVIKYWMLKYPLHYKIQELVITIGTFTYGIYILDHFGKETLWPIMENVTKSYLSTFWISILWCVVSMSIGSMLTMVLKNVPFVKKLF